MKLWELVESDEEVLESKKSKTHPIHKAGMPMSLVYPDMDPGYDYYRYMNIVAAHPHHKAAHDHEHFRDHPLSMAYTQEEMDILNNSFKGLGHKMKWISKKKPHEHESTNIASPVPHNSGAKKKSKVVKEATTQWPNDSQAALPNARVWPELDNSSPYKAYRFGVALAGNPEHPMNASGPTAQAMVTVGYTDADDKIIDAAGRNIGVSGNKITSPGSQETNHTNSQSPVPQNSGRRKKRA